MTRSRKVGDRRARRRAGRGAGLATAALGTGLAVVLVSGAALAASGGEGGGESGLIDINWTLGVQVLNFLILLGVLYLVAYKPLTAVLEGRTTAIRQQLAEAQAAREEAQKKGAEFEARLREAHAEAQAMRERALREAAETRERLTQEARQEAGRLVAAARAEIEQDVRRARSELRAEVGALAVEIAERLISRSLADDDHRRIVREALARMDAT